MEYRIMGSVSQARRKPWHGVLLQKLNVIGLAETLRLIIQNCHKIMRNNKKFQLKKL